MMCTLQDGQEEEEEDDDEEQEMEIENRKMGNVPLSSPYVFFIWVAYNCMV